MEPSLSEFLTSCDSRSLVKDITCLKNPENPRCIDIFVTNSIGSFEAKTLIH